MQAVLLPVDSDLYAVPVDWVRQVLVAPPITPLVTAPAVVRGLFNVRGEIVPLLDTATLLGIGTIATVAYAVVLGTSIGPVGLSATDLPERISVDGPQTASVLPGTAGTYYLDGRVIVMLDPAVLLDAAGLGAPAPIAGGSGRSAA